MDDDPILQRQTTHLRATDTGEIERRLKAVSVAFGSDWLFGPTTNPIAALAQRKDALATNQLVILGAAIEAGNAENPQWVRRQVNKIKGKNDGERRGATFELVALNMLRVPGRTVTPTANNFPGYDLVVTLADSAKMAVSLKNLAASTHERSFLREARAVEAAFEGALRDQGCNGLVLGALASSLPEAGDWKALTESLPALIEQSKRQAPGGIWGHEKWAAVVRNAPAEVGALSQNYLSHQVFIASPFHPNEEKNLIDRLEDAAVNARKHALADPAIAHAVMIRVGEHMSLPPFGDWAQDYLDQHPAGPIDLVLLYQLAMVEIGESSLLQHAIMPKFARSFARWARSERALAFNVVVGVGSATGSALQMAGFEDRSIERMYVHQSGEFYQLVDRQAGKPTEMRVRNLASGITQHAVVRWPDGSETVLGGIFPPTNSVTLFS